MKPVKAISPGDEKLCSCVAYIRSRIPGLPIIRTPDDLHPNIGFADLRPGDMVLFKYKNGIPHIALVEEVVGDGIRITETNYKKCTFTTRTISTHDPNIRGYYRI